MKEPRESLAACTQDAGASPLQKLHAVDFETLAGLAPDATAIPATDDIHRARIALRRSAALLHFFETEFAENRAAPARRKLQDLARLLGPARDASVWNALLAKKKIARAMRGKTGWRKFLDGERRAERNAHAALRGIWSRPGWLRPLAAAKAITCSAIASPGHQARAARAAIRILDRDANRLLKQKPSSFITDPEELHETRRKTRRFRYLAESFAPVLPRKLRRLARKLHRIESRLGKLHDLDIALAKLRRDARPIAASLAKALARRRRKLEHRMVRKK
jgi:CHAD domain-containing protein